MNERSPDKQPRHVAIIMDGNGRWARQRNISRSQGHMEGAETARATITHCARSDIRYLTLYAFSTENWERPRPEVDFLMLQLAKYLEENKQEMRDKGIKYRSIGRIEGLPSNVYDAVEETEKYTEKGERLDLLMALNYGAKTEITDACRSLCEAVSEGKMKLEDIDQCALQKNLYAPDVPDPDLLIRTGGEMRVSNFLLWQISYAELYITDVLWPDFKEHEFQKALEEYSRRERRFGRIKGEDV